MAKSNINLDPKQYQEIINQLMTSEAGYAQQLMMAMGMTGAAGASLTAATAAVTAAATASDSRSGASSRQSSPSPRLSQTPPPSQQVLSQKGTQSKFFVLTSLGQRKEASESRTLSFSLEF